MRLIQPSDTKQWIPLLDHNGREIGLYNPNMGIASAHVKMRAGYDTVINLQPPGSVMLITAGYKIALVKQHREAVCKPAYKQQLRQALADMKATGRLVVEEDWFGVDTYNIPRGFHSWSLGDAKSTAQHEAESETGLAMWDVKPLYPACSDSASRPDVTEYYHSVVNPMRRGVGLPAKSEQILEEAIFVDYQEFQHLVAEGMMIDGFTHTALNLMGMDNRDWAIGWLSCGMIQLPLKEAKPQFSMIEA